MVPRIVLTRSGPILVNTVRPINIVQSRTTVNNAGPMKNVINNAYSTARLPFNKIIATNNNNFTKKVNTVNGTRVNTARPKAVISAVKGNKGNAGNPQQDLKNKGVINSKCSRHMTGNRSYLIDYEEIDEVFVSFGANFKGGKIPRKGKIKTGKLDFEDVYFVKELNFNLFSVSQMCDKKNSVLFTDTECVVLSPDFKLTNESYVLLKVPRKDNMYSVDLKNVVPQGGLTCLFAKATLDESNLWHRRLRHVNFKTMNKLDLESFEVTYTSISSHGDPLAWVVDFFGLQEPDSPEAAPASPDYVPGPEETEQAPLSPDYVSGPEYPEYLAPSDEEVPVEDQPYVVADSPIALSSSYVADSDPKEDSEDGPVDYPADGGDGDDDDSSDNYKEEKASEEEEEEHLAPADSIVAPVVDHVPSSEETTPFETDEYALPPPPPSPLISLSPPSAEERLARCLAIPALPLSPLPIIPHPYGSPNHVRAPPGFRAAIGRLRASSPSTHHPLHSSPPLPPPPSSLHLPPYVPTSLPLASSPLPPLLTLLFIPPPVDRREAELPPRKRLCLTALTSRYKVRESSTDASRPARGHGIDYRFIGTLDAKPDVREPWRSAMGLEMFGTHRQMHDFRIASQESLMTTLITHVSSLQGQLSATLGQIQALQARGQTHADDHEGAGTSMANNMPPRRSSATARAAAAAARAAAAAAARAAAAATAAAAPMTAAAVEQLIEARVSVALANHETLQNSTNGTKGVVVLSQWFEKMESVFHIGNCAIVTQDVAYSMDWKALKKMMIVKYYPKGEIKKLEIELWNLKESDEVEKYVGGLPDMILGNNTGCAYTARPGEKREYTGSLPLCTKFNYHHKGLCAPRCNKCKKIGHLAHDYRSSGSNGNNNNHGNSETTQNAGTCYECGL
ncbi:ribonuclease H-like domain-containing protein [Tanacetum coccineum]